MPAANKLNPAKALVLALLLLTGAGWAASPWHQPAARFVHYLRASGCERQVGEPLSFRERVVYAYILATS